MFASIKAAKGWKWYMHFTKKNSHCCSQHLLTLCILFVPGQRVFQRGATSWCSGRKLERPTISRCRSNPFKRQLLKLDGCFFWGWRCLFSIWCHLCKMKWWSNVMMKWVFFNIFQSDLLTQHIWQVILCRMRGNISMWPCCNLSF